MNVVGGVVLAVGMIAIMIVVAAASFLIFRRWLLDRRGRLFDCALHTEDPTCPWRAGLAVYQGEELHLHWLWSFRIRPRYRIARRGARVVEQRGVTAEDDQQIFWASDMVRVSFLNEHRQRDELMIALGPGSCLGLTIWLESAPPGQVRQF